MRDGFSLPTCRAKWHEQLFMLNSGAGPGCCVLLQCLLHGPAATTAFAAAEALTAAAPAWPTAC